jgi:general secretion pathway protein F
MTAAERGIPLASAARAFAAERRDRLGRRAEDLAEYLEAGLPLALALTRSGHSLPPSVLLAAELGQQTSTLGPSLRQALCRSEESEAALQWAAEKVVYLGIVAIFGLCLVVFMMIKIVPAYIKIFQDFGADLPPVTVAMVFVSNYTVNYWFLFVPLLLLLLFLLLHVGLNYMGVRRSLPGWARSWQSTDSAVVMRWLAAAVRQNRPLTEMMRLLAAYYPRRGVRRKLEWTAKRMDQGADWCDCLGQAGLIRRPEIAVFKSASRTGNLAWALDEMADSSVRRAACRLRALVTVAFPVMVLVMGGCVLFFAMAMFPIMYLIQHLI